MIFIQYPGSDILNNTAIDFTGVFSSEVCHSNDPASKTSDQLVQVRQELVADFNWKKFSFHCISRAFSRTDSLL